MLFAKFSAITFPVFGRDTGTFLHRTKFHPTHRERDEFPKPKRQFVENPNAGLRIAPHGLLGTGNFMKVAELVTEPGSPTLVLKSFLDPDSGPCYFSKKSQNTLSVKSALIQGAFDKAEFLQKGRIPHLPIINSREDALTYFRLIMPKVRKEHLLSRQSPNINEAQIFLLKSVIQAWPTTGFFMIDPKAENMCLIPNSDPTSLEAPQIGFLDVLDSHCFTSQEDGEAGEEFGMNLLKFQEEGELSISPRDYDAILAELNSAITACKNTKTLQQMEAFKAHFIRMRDQYKLYGQWA